MDRREREGPVKRVLGWAQFVGSKPPFSKIDLAARGKAVIEPLERRELLSASAVALPVSSQHSHR